MAPVVNDPLPEYSDHLRITNTEAAHSLGFTGDGYAIGVIDTGVNSSHPAFGDRVVANHIAINPNTNDMSVDDKHGHGTAVALAAAGSAFGQWPGGVAPGAEIVSVRIINDEPPEDDGSGQGNEVGGTSGLGLQPIHDQLVADGVHIMNNSWGGLYWTNAASTAPIAAEYRNFILDHGGLVVFSTGNSGFDNPSDTAALPSKLGTDGTAPGADLELGWLAVAAVVEAESDGGGESIELAEYSNACGVAKNYCLVAPGTVVATGTNDAPDDPTYWRWQGTSFAAPLVSGAAALVWEAFPYFDNDLVRQTLLGTATDIGEQGVDDLFGYGLLNVGAAVLGPAKFDWGDVHVSFEGNSIWSNPISGAGGLTKSGDGFLLLDSAHLYGGDEHTVYSYQGDTVVDGGVLWLAGTLTDSDVFIRGDGTFTGNGWVHGNVHAQGGTLALRATGTQRGLFVDGDYHHSADSTLAVTVGAGALDVLGQATIEGGTLYVEDIVTDLYVPQRDELILTAEGGVTGTFDTAEFNSNRLFLDGGVWYDANNVWLYIERLNVVAAALSINAISPASLASAQRIEGALQRVDQLLWEPGGTVGEGFIRAAGEFQNIADVDTAKASLQSLSGDLHANAATATFDAIDMGRRALSARSEDLAGQPLNGGAWAQQLGQGGRGGFNANGFDSHGWLVGQDMRLGAQGFAGAAFGQTDTRSQSGSMGSRSRDTQTSALAYGGHSFGDAYLLGQLGMGHFDRQLRRNLFTGRRTMGVHTDYSGRYLTANVEAGYRIGDGRRSLTPYVGAEYTRIDSDGFSEAGGDGLGLMADSWRSSRTQGIAGLRLGQAVRAFALSGYVEWQHALDTSGLDIQASFTEIDMWSSLQGLQPARSGGLFGAALERRLGEAGTMSLGYDQRFGPRGSDRMLSAKYSLGF